MNTWLKFFVNKSTKIYKQEATKNVYQCNKYHAQNTILLLDKKTQNSLHQRI